MPRHPKDASVGLKVKHFGPQLLLQADDAAAATEGEEITLMGWGNAKITKVLKNADGSVAKLEGALYLQGDVKAKTRKLTWLAETPELQASRLALCGLTARVLKLNLDLLGIEALERL